MAHLDPFFTQVDSLQDKFIERLREAVAIPSISSEDARRPDVVKVSTALTPSSPRQPLMFSQDGPLVGRPDQGARRNRRAP